MPAYPVAVVSPRRLGADGTTARFRQLSPFPNQNGTDVRSSNVVQSVLEGGLVAEREWFLVGWRGIRGAAEQVAVDRPARP
jgi:hypothetical protein